MKLKIAKYLVYGTSSFLLVCMILCIITKLGFFGYLGLGLFVAALVLWFIFGKCPACGKFLGRTQGKNCPCCGKEINW